MGEAVWASLIPRYELDPLVAVKVLPVFQEAKAASVLYQPNIVTIHEIGCEDGADFIVM